jgi:hypothetical protein
MFMHADGCCRRGRAVSHVFIAGEFNLNLGYVYLGNLKIQKYRCNLKVQIYISSTCFPKSGVIILPDFVSYTHFYLQSLELSSTSSTFHLSSTTIIQQVSHHLISPTSIQNTGSSTAPKRTALSRSALPNTLSINTVLL